MKRVGCVLCALAASVMVIASVSGALARALIAIPLQGQSAQQQENDRSACADYAVAVSGYSPSGLPMIVRAGPPGIISGPVPTPPIMVQTAQGPVVTSAPPPAGLIGGIINRRQLAALDVLYANYLAAGAACLTARGYQVQTNIPWQFGERNAKLDSGASGPDCRPLRPSCCRAGPVLYLRHRRGL